MGWIEEESVEKVEASKIKQKTAILLEKNHRF
jgi:hypothetical protein